MKDSNLLYKIGNGAQLLGLFVAGAAGVSALAANAGVLGVAALMPVTFPLLVASCVLMFSGLAMSFFNSPVIPF
jgi:hypothetical protein